MIYNQPTDSKEKKKLNGFYQVKGKESQREAKLCKMRGIKK